MPKTKTQSTEKRRKLQKNLKNKKKQIVSNDSFVSEFVVASSLPSLLTSADSEVKIDQIDSVSESISISKSLVSSERHRIVMAEIRRDRKYRESEKVKDKLSKQNLRQSNGIVREEQKASNRRSMKTVRENADKRQAERERDRETKKVKREDESVLKKKREQNRIAYNKKMKDVIKSQSERIKDKAVKNMKRQDKDFRAAEREKDSAARKQKRTSENNDQLIQNPKHFEFRQLIKEGPTSVCCCCLRLWFPRTCKEVNRETLQKKFGSDLCDKVFNNGQSNLMCTSCSSTIRSKKTVPRLCAKNYNIVFEIPPELKNLTCLEERLICARIPFMSIRKLGWNLQCSVVGQIVNVPLNVDTTAKVLPRNVNDTQVIQLKLKKRLHFERAYMCETIRPKKVMDALKYLINQPLYQSEGITISTDWEKNLRQNVNRDQITQTRVSQKNTDLNNLEEIVETTQVKSNSASETASIVQLFSQIFVDEWQNSNINAINNQYLPVPDDRDQASNLITNSLEVAIRNMLVDNDEEGDVFEREDVNENLNPGGEETLLDNQQLENICIAPGENMIPKHLMLDTYAEELSFASIFCGHKKQFFIDVKYSTIAKIQSCHMDRRFARTDFLLYMFKKLQLFQVVDAVSVYLRQKINKNPGTFNAGQALDKDYLKQLINRDLGYSFLKTIRSCPAHWEQEKKKLLSMIRQFDVPTVFFTVSAAETAWPELLVVLSQVVDGKQITEDEAMNLTFAEKTRLIRTDPITCARYFDNRFHLLLKHMKSKDGPFKEYMINHWYFRVEMQHRGSPHVHGLLWLNNAPKYDKDDLQTLEPCIKLVDELITCDSSKSSVQDIIHYQTHHHSKSCKKEVRGMKICRYGIPFLPMSETIILSPKSGLVGKELAEMVEQYRKIKRFLDDNKDKNYTFVEFLAKLSLTKEQYHKVIEYNIKTPTVFLKRSLKDCYMNPFNEEIFSLQRSNMDIQFILDPYACVNYIVNYINKSDRGVSKLLREAMEEIKKGNLELKQQLKTLGNAFLNASEVSAQECAYSVIPLHLSETCTQYAFINTKPINERVKMLKSRTDLAKLDADSTEIYLKGMIDHYEKRPVALEDICLAEFAAYYRFAAKDNRKDESKKLKLLDDSGYLFKKNHANIISFIRYGLQTDPVNYYREQVMLYKPWRDEQKELEGIDHKIIYSLFGDVIAENRRKFNCIDSEILDDALVEAERYMDDLSEIPITEVDPEYMPYGVDDRVVDVFPNADTNNDPSVDKQTFQTPRQVSDEEFREIVSSLNEKQYEYLNHVLKNVNDGRIYYEIISGGAGCGKSRLIMAIYQSLLRHYNSIPGNDPDQLKILLAAPTGKAAFQIGGLTLHSSFVLPINQLTMELIPLSESTVNSLHTTLFNLKLIIIDEFSMMGARVFNQINLRLKQIFKSNSDFGNISIILVGDLRQLPPVGDKWLFDSVYRDPYAVITGSYLWDKFGYFELTEIMRQKDNIAFAMALNALAIGEMTNEQVNLIKSREIGERDPIVDETIHLFRSNIEVDAFNAEKLSKYNTESYVSIARDIIKGACTERLKQMLLKHAFNLKKSESFGLMYTLPLQVDAKYMITLNIDVEDGLVNGACGVLRKVCLDGSQIPLKLWIEFPDSKVGKNSRQKYAGQMKAAQIPENWTLIEKIARAVKVKKGSVVHVERLQFPVTPAEAITIHKSQGATLKYVAVHIKKGLPRNSLYVACSRATSLSGLYIYGQFLPPHKPNENDLVFKEIENLKTNKRLVTAYSKQFFQNKGSTILAYQNVQSFKKHKSYITNNPIFKNADILMFVETWVANRDAIELKDFTCFAKICNEAIRKPYGILCYIRNASLVNVKLEKQYLKSVRSLRFQAINFLLDEYLCIVVLYIPPKFKTAIVIDVIREIMQDIGDKKCLIIGDFNRDLLRSKNNSIKKLLETYKLVSLLKINTSTTSFNTQIDWCFGNILNRTKVNIYETVYSHHKAIAVNIFDDDISSCITSPKQDDGQQHDKLMFNVVDEQSKEGDSKKDDGISVPKSSMQVTSPDIFDSDSLDIEMITGIIDKQILKKPDRIKDDEMSISDSLISVASPDIFSSDSDNIEVIDLDSAKTTPSDIFKHSGLQNLDGVSCYANSITQCLLLHAEFRTSVLKGNSHTNRCFSEIMNKQVNSCDELRQHVGGIFTRKEQQDAQEFLAILIERHIDEDFTTLVTFSHRDVCICMECNFHDQGERSNDNMLLLRFPEPDTATITFGRLFIAENAECRFCNSYNMIMQTKLDSVNKYLMVCLQRYTWADGMGRKIHTTFTSFDNNRVTINSFVFRVKAVAMHLGDTINRGHYISIIRRPDGVWQKCNDGNISVIEHFDDTLKDVYLLFLEKIHDVVV